MAKKKANNETRNRIDRLFNSGRTTETTQQRVDRLYTQKSKGTISDLIKFKKPDEKKKKQATTTVPAVGYTTKKKTKLNDKLDEIRTVKTEREKANESGTQPTNTRLDISKYPGSKTIKSSGTKTTAAVKKQAAQQKASIDPNAYYGKGNIDLNSRKVVRNADGSISTERSFSTNIDGKEVLLPTVIDGKIVGEDEAINHYKKTGQHLGMFDTIEEADKYAKKLHNRQDWYYGDRNAKVNKTVMNNVDKLIRAAQIKEERDPSSKIVTETRYAKDEDFSKYSDKGQAYLRYIKNAIESGKGDKEIKAASEQAYKDLGMDAFLEVQSAASDMLDEYYGRKEPREVRYKEPVRSWKDAQFMEMAADPNSEMNKKILDRYNKEYLAAQAGEATPYEKYKSEYKETDKQRKARESTQRYVKAKYQNEAIKRKEGMPPFTSIPEDYEEKKDMYDRQLYDYYFGTNMYYWNTQRNTSNREQTEAQIQAMWEDIDRVDKELTEMGLGDEWRDVRTDEKRRKEAYSKNISYNEYKDYINRHPNDEWDMLPYRREEAESEIGRLKNYVDTAIPATDEARMKYENDWIWDYLIHNELPPFTEIPADYAEKKEEYDRQLYDAMMGDGSYDDIMRDGNKNSMSSMEDVIQRMWDDIDRVDKEMAEEDPTGSWKQGYKGANLELTYWNNELKNIEMNESMQADYNDLIYQYGRDVTSTDYIQEYDRGTDSLALMSIENFGKSDEGGIGFGVHEIYSFLTGGKEYQTYVKMKGTENFPISQDYRYAMLMTDGTNGTTDERGIFINLYNKAMNEGREPTEAMEFLLGLNNALTWRYENRENITYAEFAERNPLGADITSLVEGQIEPIEGTARTIAGFFGDKDVQNPNSYWYASTRAKQKIQAERAEKYGKTGGKIYLGIMNSLNNMVNGLTTAKMFGGASEMAQEILGLGKFAMQVYQESTHNYLTKTRDYNKSSWLGFLDAMVEVGTEMLPYDTMLHSGSKGLFVSMLANIGSEAGEEFTGGTLGENLKDMFKSAAWGDVDRFTERASEIYAEGGYTDEKGNWVDLDKTNQNLAYDQAMLQSIKEDRQDVLEQTLGGAFGGGFAGTYGTIGNAIGVTKTGKAITNENNTQKGESGLQRLIKAASGMKGTKSQQMAENMQTRLDEGKNVSDYQAGKLAATMMEETSEEHGKIVEENMMHTVRQQLMDAGMGSAEANEAAGAIVRSLNNKKVTKEDLAIISKDQHAIDLWKKYNTFLSDERDELETNVQKATKETRSVANLLGDLTGANAKAQSVLGSDIDYSNQNTKSKAEAVDDFAKRRWDVMSETYAEAAKKELENNPELQKSKTFLEDTVKIRLAAYAYDDMPVTNLDEATTKRLYDAAIAERDAEDSERIVKQNKVKPGEGKVTFDGVEATSQEWEKTINENRKLNGRQKLMVHTTAQIARQMGINVNFVYITGKNKDTGVVGEDIYGYESEQTGAVTINLAGRDTNGMTHNILATLPHEFTHWLEQNSRENYAKLRKFILNELRAKGENIEEILIHSMNNQNTVLKSGKTGEVLDLQGAMAELIARSCEGLFTSTEMRNRLEQQDPGLFKAAQNYVRQFAARLKAAIKGLDSSMSREARILQNKMDEIAKIWWSGYEEALSREEEGAEPTKGDRYSTADRSYIAAVDSGNTEEAQKQVEQAAKEAGYTDKAYHGTDSFGFTEFSLEKGQDTVFVAYTKDVAGTYTEVDEVRAINRNANIDYDSMFSDELAEYAMDIISEANDDGSYLMDIQLNEEWSDQGAGEVFDLIWERYDADEDRDYDYVQTVPRSALIKMIESRREKKGIYELYTKPGKQLVLNLKEDNWDRIPWNAVMKGTNGEAENWKNKIPYQYLKTRQIASMAKSNGYDSVRINNVRDHGGRNLLKHNGIGDIGIFFNPNDVKSADTITFDMNGNVIPPSKRFNTTMGDIRYSVKEGDKITGENGEMLAEVLPGGTIAKYSLRSWNEDNQKTLFNKLVKAGYDPVKVRKWIHDVDSIAAIIADDRQRLDYKADRSHKFKKPNADVYKYTLEASTLCAKRLLYQGTFNAIQKLLPNTPLKPGDLIELANMMHEMGFQTPCGICYVESRRRHTGNAAEQWLKTYEGEYKPNYAELTTTDGLARLKEEHPQAYKDFIKAMNKRGSGSVKLVQTRTDYRKDLRRMSEDMVNYLNSVGGIRVQSFSDFETPHLIDMMQAVLDMTMKGLKSQGYTKVPNFAWVFGDTGIKINLSEIGKGKGYTIKGGRSFEQIAAMPYETAKALISLEYDGREGMEHGDAIKLRNRYSRNVGTILVGINEAHIIAAMADGEVDFIIPFHRSGWSQEEFDKMTTLKGYDDFEKYQNEKHLTINEDGSYEVRSLDKGENNIMPEEYWNFDENGQANAERYLAICAERGLQPKFWNFLVDNGDGSYSLPAGSDYRSTAIREGYWKTLIDFKMYDNDGVGAPQTVVTPKVNMQEAFRVLREYEGGADTLKAADPVVERYVREYKEKHPERTLFSVRQPDMEVQQFMLGMNENSLSTQQEKTMHRQFKELDMALKVARLSDTENNNKLKQLEAKEKPSAYDKEQMAKLRIRIANNNSKISRLEGEMIRVTTNKGYAALMARNEKVMRNLASGRTLEEVHRTVEALTKQLREMDKQIEEREKNIKEMRDDLAYRKTATLIKEKDAQRMAGIIKKEYGSNISTAVLERSLTEIRLKMAAKQSISEDVEELAWKILSGVKGEGSVYLDILKGKNIVLGKGQMAELKATNRTMKEIRKELAGTGITIRAAKGDEAGLDNDWDELCDMIPSLDRSANEKDQLDELLRVIRSEKQNLTGETLYADHLEEMVTDLKAMIATIGVNAPSDKAAVEILNRMNKLVNEMDAGMEKSAEELKKARAELAALVDQGKMALDQATSAQFNVDTAIKYNNMLAEQSEAALWKSEKWKLIEQLKSENTKALMLEQEKWKQKIAKDKTAREMMQSNQQLRKQIHTNITRIRKLLVNETDLKNIPEHMKGLAREMLGMIVDNDLIGRKISGIARQDLVETRRILNEMEKQDGAFTADDLRLITDEEAQATVLEALANLEDGIKFYNASTSGDILSNLQGFRNALQRVADAVTTIVNVIHAEQTISLGDRRVMVADAAEEIAYDMRNSRFKGEKRGRGSKAINATQEAVVYGNTTPVYFFKNLRNRGMMKQWNEFRRGENRNGLEVQKARIYVRGLAEKTHYRDWADQKHIVRLGGKDMELSIGHIMSLYAIWRREHTSNPEMSDHLKKGGVFFEQEEENEGKLRYERQQMRPVRVSDADVLKAYELLTDDQKAYLEGMVRYLSNEMSELGNEASMRMYGIKKYKESYYFPMMVWDGVKSARSDKGISGTTENRAANKSWSKRRINKAQNALVIKDFTETAVGHIVEMINYNTMAPAIENMNKVLNYKRTEYDRNEVDEDASVQRNIRVMFQEAYGKHALNYLETFLKDINGGLVQDNRKTLRERALSMFKKNAVAGSLSVAAQQPLSYIRAAMMINPKYLAQALNPTYYKGSLAEMLQYSGVAVIKQMGRFDMNFGQSAKDWIAPETNPNLYEKISDTATKLPELADTMTWTRMWSAAKIEQHALHPEMDIKSDEFLQKVADRFNEVMQKTQVYDSVLVKSNNMRSKRYTMKVITSFMAEPTLSLNVLADAVLNFKEAGGKAMMGKAAATFILSAAMQAFVKGLMGSGRTPDEKKTWWENFLYKYQVSLMGEVNPMGLIPGYSDIIEVIKNGELNDDAMGVIGKIFGVYDTISNAIGGKGKGWYRDLEDTVGQVAQLFTNIPAKNLMRDARAMYNWISQEPYAKRASSAAVMRKQAEGALFNADNLLGAINKKLGEAGFKTTNAAYYSRMFDAMYGGNKKEAAEIKEYMMLAKGASDDSVTSGLKAAAKKKLEPAEADRWMLGQGMMENSSQLTTQYKKGDITREEYAELLKEQNPKLTDEEIRKKIDLVDYQKETGNNNASGDYYRLNDALEAGDDDAIQKAKEGLIAEGKKESDINGKIKSYILEQYKKGEIDRETAEQQLKKYNKDLSKNDMWFLLDKADYKRDGGEESSDKYYRLYDAMDENKAADIQSAVKLLIKHGVEKKNIRTSINNHYRDLYKQADKDEKRKIRDAMQKAYRAAGYSAEDANKTISNWK